MSAASPAPAMSIQTEEAAALTRRYTDAYRVATMTVRFGKGLKILGVVFAAIAFLIALLISSEPRMGMADRSGGILFGLIIAALLWTGFWIAGVLVMAQGQTLLASLDSAVNSSPFLANPQKAEVMRLHSVKNNIEANETNEMLQPTTCPHCRSVMYAYEQKCTACGKASTLAERRQTADQK